MSFSPVNWGDYPPTSYISVRCWLTTPYIHVRLLAETIKTSSHSKETRPRSRLPQVGDDGEPGVVAAFEASSLLNEAGTEMLEGAWQEDLSRPRSNDEAA